MRLLISIQLDNNMCDALDEFRGSLRLAGVRRFCADFCTESCV